LTELGGADLRFTLEEAADFLRRTREPLEDGSYAATPDGYAGRLLEHFAAETGLYDNSGDGISRSGRAPGLEPLSEREIVVLELVASGHSNAEIAGELYLSVGTVKAHVHHIFDKLLVRNSSQAVARVGELRMLATPR
jgi:ATP/maltotriose-dependent transcriptional regulator MalT